MKTAVILAAGMGYRIKNLFDIPKGFIEINNISLIERSISILKEFGIKNILIGTGYKSNLYENMQDGKHIFCIKNKFYYKSGSFYTLYNLRNVIKENFLLLESDLIYEKAVIKSLINSTENNVLIASNLSGSNDEVYIKVDNNKYLKKISKNKNKIIKTFGEFVGISKISYDSFISICNWTKKNVDKVIDLHYEDIFSINSSNIKFKVKKLENLIWSEIDTEEHYKNVIDNIYPNIIKNEK